jgi:ABC-type multidrug transport system fused ATPase/permease subunit
MTLEILSNVRNKKKPVFCLIIVLMSLQTVLTTICVTELIKRIVALILEKEAMIDTLLFFFVGMFCVYGIVYFSGRMISFYYQKSATKALEKEALCSLCKLDRWDNGFDGMSLLPKIRNDVYQYTSLEVTLLNQKTEVYTNIIFGSIYAIITNVYVYAGCLIVIGVIFFITKRAYPKLKEYEYAIGNEFNRNYANINEIINNIGIIHLLNPKHILEDFRDVAKKNVDLNIRKGRVFAYVFICKKISNVFLVFMTCFLGVIFQKEAGDPVITISEIAALAYLIPNISKKILEIIDINIQNNNMKATGERIDHLFDLKKYDETGKEGISSISEISINKLRFSYGTKPVIDNMTHTFKRGQVTVLQGESGCGKSTLLKIICRVIPVSDGMVFVNSLDINRIHRESIWRRSSYASQVSHVVKGSIKDNILMGRELDIGKLQKAIHISTLDESLNNFPNGLEEIVSEENISSGEKQKIALARAIYKEPDFLCLDEITAAMDPASQRMVMENVAEYVQEKGIFCAYVSHSIENDHIPNVEIVKLLGAGNV